MRLLRKGLRKNTRNDTFFSPVIARSEATWQSHIDTEQDMRLLRSPLTVIARSEATWQSHIDTEQV
ncbi:hypothetical protein KAW96_00975 [candidate division WOR-3 bacterium]|nr:hypothetical protein [candidate division WOR-3 bacterium]